MASASSRASDALYCLRASIASGGLIIPSKSSETPSDLSEKLSLAAATHLHFATPKVQRFELKENTRFISTGKAVDLRSIYFAWLQKDVTIPEYIASAQRLNEELAPAAGGVGGAVKNLVFVERLDLITWLEGASEESEYIKPLENDASAIQAADSAAIASGAAGGIGTISSGGHAGKGKVLDPRLSEIYSEERKIGDRNTILRGIKPTDFSHVRKTALSFLGKDRSRGAAPTSSVQANKILPRRPGRRADPIILLSPSASSILRMTNIKSFLDLGNFVPSDSALAGPSQTNIHHISRTLPSIDPNRPLRFTIVDSAESFKPDYWSRVVAVFTTGQAWQFRSYKWQDPPDLFRNILGIYVGWKGEHLPATIKQWGRGVKNVQVDKWNESQGVSGRWRDREVVESVWAAIEEAMRSKGWGKEGGPAGSFT